MPSLFDSTVAQPLADRLRPQTIDEVVGQDHLLSADAPLGRMLITGKVSSFILWGPPGCGKTTIARLLAHHTDMAFEPISAVFSGVADLRKIFETAPCIQKEPYFLWMKFTALTVRSRTAFCLMSKTEPSFWSVRRRKIRPLN